MASEIFVPFPHIWPGNQSIGFFSEESKDFNERGGVSPALGGHSRQESSIVLSSARHCSISRDIYVLFDLQQTYGQRLSAFTSSLKDDSQKCKRPRPSLEFTLACSDCCQHTQVRTGKSEAH